MNRLLSSFMVAACRFGGEAAKREALAGEGDEQDGAAGNQADGDAGHQSLQQNAREVGEHGPPAQAARRERRFSVHQLINGRVTFHFSECLWRVATRLEPREGGQYPPPLG